MRKWQFPWLLAGILFLGWAAGHIAGLALTALGLSVVYGASLRLHPRIRHRKCKGSGEHHSPLFPWTHRRCGRCAGGRIVRWGAGNWGTEAIRREHRTAVASRAAAKRDRTWR
jgi:hypothetical protein